MPGLPPGLTRRVELDLLTLVYPHGYPPEPFTAVQPGTSLADVCELLLSQAACVFVRGYWGNSLVICFECFFFREHWIVRQLQGRRLTKTSLSAELGDPILLLPRQIHLYQNIKDMMEAINSSFDAAPPNIQWAVASLGPGRQPLKRQVPHLQAARATAASLGVQCPEQLAADMPADGPNFELVLIHEDGSGRSRDEWVLEGRRHLVTSLLGLQQLCKTPMFRCWVCRKPAPAVCERCRKVSFCSQDCAQRGFVAHAQECKPPQEASSSS